MIFKSKILKQKLGIQNACLIEKNHLVSRNVHNGHREASVKWKSFSTCAGPSAAVSWGYRLDLLFLLCSVKLKFCIHDAF